MMPNVYFPSLQYERSMDLPAVPGGTMRIPVFFSQVFDEDSVPPPRISYRLKGLYGHLAAEDSGISRAVTVNCCKSYFDFTLTGMNVGDRENLYIQIGPCSLTHRRDEDWLGKFGQEIGIVITIIPARRGRCLTLGIDLLSAPSTSTLSSVFMEPRAATDNFPTPVPSAMKADPIPSAPDLVEMKQPRTGPLVSSEMLDALQTRILDHQLGLMEILKKWAEEAGLTKSDEDPVD